MENFEKVASTLVDDPAILNVLVAPGGVVSDVYPRKGNEAVLGLNFFARGAGNQEAVEARDAGHLILGGPFPLVQGAGSWWDASACRYMDDGKGGKLFWGWSPVTLKFPQALNGANWTNWPSNTWPMKSGGFSPDTNKSRLSRVATMRTTRTRLI